MLDAATTRAFITAQRNEITEAAIYRKLARSVTDAHNSEVLARIGDDEAGHYQFFKERSGLEVKPSRLTMWWFFLIAKVLGLTFGIKLMEKGEQGAQKAYDVIARTVPEVHAVAEDEERHERELIDMLDEERLKYVGSMVLGLNDALVELTGALAGLTLAFANTRLIAMAGLITGLAASLSMAASEYLSTKTEGTDQSAVKASVYTGIAYVLTVMFLITPYLIFDNLYVCLGLAVCAALIVILAFTYYVSVAQDVSFRDRFLEMAGISLGVAVLSFGIGFVVRLALGIEV